MSSMAHREPCRTGGPGRPRPADPGGETRNCSITPVSRGNAALDGAGNLALVVRRVDPELARRRYSGCGYTSARLISRDRGVVAVRANTGADKDPACARDLARVVDARPGYRPVRLARLR